MGVIKSHGKDSRERIRENDRQREWRGGENQAEIRQGQDNKQQRNIHQYRVGR